MGAVLRHLVSLVKVCLHWVKEAPWKPNQLRGTVRSNKQSQVQSENIQLDVI